MRTTSRRLFIGTSLVAAGALVLPTFSILRSTKPLQILILGGTGFIGPYVVQYALDRGHQITLFNRGRTNPDLFPDVEKLIGDREDNLEPLKGRQWDAVIDNSGYIPRHVKLSVESLRNSVNRYLFTSSRQVYRDPYVAPAKKEDAPQLEVTTENPGGYAARKTICERHVRRIFGDRATIVRPTVIVGPRDYTDRFTYWTVRIDRGGDVLAPGDGFDPIQFIDVRDLAEFMVHLLEKDYGGPFNAAGPASHLSTAEFLHGIRSITSSKLQFIWVSADFLRQQGVRPRDDIPLWTPATVRGGKTEGPINPEKSITHGLRYRPLSVTARDTLDWFLARDNQRINPGMTQEQEARLLAVWRSQQRNT